MERQRGFTLIEIAIVLVIIGLLLGGVLKGRELITSSKARRILNDFDGLAVAIFTYQERYGALPGDDPDADSRFGLTGSAAENNGNGDGVIEGRWNQPAGAASETRRLWLHLRAAGLVPGATRGGADAEGGNPRANPYGGLVGVDSANLGLSGIVACMGAIPGKVAGIIDSQIDDGVSDAGSFRTEAQPDYDGPNASRDAYAVANDSVAMTICRTL